MIDLAGITRPRLGGMAPGNPAPHSPLQFQNRVLYDVVGPDGAVKQHGEVEGNIMVTYGLNRLVEMLASDTTGALYWANAMAIGTDSTAANSTNSALGNSTQGAGTFTASDAGDMTLQYNATFASDGNAAAIHEVGVFQTDTYSASMIARSVLGTASINRGASDQINVSYQIIAKTAA